MGLNDNYVAMFSIKGDVNRVTLQEFNISYILLQDSHIYHIFTMD